MSKTDLTSRYAQARRQELVEAFKFFDSNDNGELDAIEIMRTMVKLGKSMTKEDAEIVIKQLDVDNNGTLDFEEFEKFIKIRDTLNPGDSAAEYGTVQAKTPTLPIEHNRRPSLKDQRPHNMTKKQSNVAKQMQVKEKNSLEKLQGELERGLKTILQAKFRRAFLDYDEFTVFMREFCSGLDDLELYDMFKGVC